MPAPGGLFDFKTMKKRIRNFVALLCATVMGFSWIPTDAIAIEEETSNDVVNIVYTIGDSTETHIAKLNLIGTTTMGTLSGNAYLATLPEDSKVQSYTWNTQVNAVLLLSRYGTGNASSANPSVNHSEIIADTSNYLQNGDFQGVDGKAPIASMGWNTLDENAKNAISLTNVSGFVLLTANPRTIVYVQIPIAELNTDSLKGLVEQTPSTGYYDREDRWNGKIYSNQGFWQDMQAAYNQATALLELESAAAQTDIDNAEEALKNAIANLIPTTQVNATRLYEAVQAYQKLKESDYTAASWAEGERLYDKMVTLLDSLFDEEGNATDANTADRQAEADALVDQVYNDGIANKYWNSDPLVNKGAYDGYYTVYETRRQEALSLLSAYDPARLTGSDYTAETWSAYTAAYDALKKDMEHTLAGGTWADYRMVSMFETHLERLISARLQLAGSGDVTFSFTYVNNLPPRYPSLRGEAYTEVFYDDAITLTSGNTSLADALEAAGITYSKTGDLSLPGGVKNTSDTDPFLVVYFDGEYVTSLALSDLDSSPVQIQNGAEVKVARCVHPIEEQEASTGYDSSAWDEYMADTSTDYSDSFALIGIEGPAEQVAVGDKVTFTGTVTGASYSHLGEDFGGAGLTLFVSEPSEDETLAAPSRETTAVTGADGSLEYVFTQPGWYTVALFDLTEDDPTATDIMGVTTLGTYPSLYAGDFMLVHVGAASDEAALLAQYRVEKAAEAKAFFVQYHDYDFAAGYYEETFRPLYDTLQKNLETATTFVDLMERYEQDYQALRKAAAPALDHAAILAALRADLALIPSDLSAMDETYETLVTGVQSAYAALNDYQKSLLTQNELDKLDQIAAINVDALTKLTNVTVTFYKPGETEYPFATTQGTFSGTGGAALYSWPNLNWISHRQPNGGIPDPDWKDPRAYAESMSAQSGDYVYVRLYLETTEAQYWPMWQVDDGDWQLFEPAVYGGVEGYYLATWRVPEDAAEGSTYHIDLKMVSKTEYEEIARQQDAEGVAEAKAAAIDALNAAYQQYRADTSISAATLVEIETAWRAGVEAVNAAGTNTEVAEARRAALAAMSNAAGGTVDVSDVDYDSGETVGRVHLIIENTTYAGGPFYGAGSIADGWYPLGANDTMMTVVLKALEAGGYTWTGTGGTTSNGYDITYLAGVYKDGLSLTEKQGTTASGWMGTLNDWFTNYGFQSFSYRNGGIEDSDEIHIMFTLDGGDDVGSSWNSSDTRLAALEISSGTLAPAFSPDVTDYLLVVPEGRTALQVIPEAVNKNYQTRTFLNQYNSDSSRYKISETISVMSGDVIYVGVGESGWPTMNTGGRATKYTFQVVTLADALEALPETGEVTQSNYPVYDQMATILQSMVLSQSFQGDTSKLKALQERVRFYEEIDKVRELIAALPSLAQIQADPSGCREQVTTANTAYSALSVAQKAYLSSAEVSRLTQAVEAVGGDVSDTDLEAVRKFNDLVDAIGSSVTVSSESAITAARTAYAALTAEQVALVTERYNTLCNAEAALLVVKQIAAIGTVTLESESAITAARSAYAAYTSQFPGQDMVSNLSVLEAAEAALAKLQQGGGDTTGYQDAMDTVLDYLAKEVPSPGVGSTNGEWAVLAQVRAGQLASSARTQYLAALRSHVQQLNGVLDTSKTQTLHTEYSRIILALTALGEDAERFTVGSTTYDLVDPLLDASQDSSTAYAYQVSEQGNNGTIFALIALDSGGYRNDAEGNQARAAWIDLLIDKQQDDGNWPIYNPDQVVGSGGDLGGVDVCAMALQALAPYYLDQSKFAALNTKHTYAELKSTVEKALTFLSQSQSSTGGYGNAEASAQVVVALSALKMDAASDSGFVKNGLSVLADLLSYRTGDGGFSHMADAPTNQMASEQSAYALVAYHRYKTGKTSLYDMSDAFSSQPAASYTIEAKAGTGGTISPSGSVSVERGESQSFIITPIDGYQIADILVDGISIWAGGVMSLNLADDTNDILVPEIQEEATCSDGTHVGETLVLGRRAATCTERGYTGDTICGACGEVLRYGTETDLLSHQYGTAWQSDETGHWQVCQICGARSDVEHHELESTDVSELPDQEIDPDEVPLAPTPGDSGTSEEAGPDEGVTEPDDGTTDADSGEQPTEGSTAETPDEEDEEAGETSSGVEDDPPAEGEDPDAESTGTGDAEDVEDAELAVQSLSVVSFRPVRLMSLDDALSQAAGDSSEEGHVCQICGYSEETGGTEACSHSGGTATCTARAVCEYCGLPYGGYAEHTFTETDYSSGVHWDVCADCGLEDLSSLAPHDWELDEAASTETVSVYYCRYCGAEQVETVTAAPAVAAISLLATAESESYTYTFRNVTADHTISATFEKLSPVIVQEVVESGRTQTATITEEAVEKAVEAVVSTGASSVTILPTEVNDSISEVRVELPSEAAQIIANANASMEVQTTKGTVTLSQPVLQSIADQSRGGELLSVCVEELGSRYVEDLVPAGTNLDGSVAVEVTILLGARKLTTFDRSYLTVMIPVDNSFTPGQQYDVLVISSDGTVDELTGRCGASDGQRYVTVRVNHLSTFVVLAESAELYTITATSNDGGEIDPYGRVEVEAGTDQTFYIIPDDGYIVADVLVDWESVGAVEYYTFRDVEEDHEIRAIFQRGVEIPDFGPVVGSVYVSVENTTYRGGDFRGTIVSGWYDLCARDTMMTCVLKALAMDGYSWWGTGASDTGGYDITYLAGIYVDENGNGRRDSSEPSLAEFDGSRGSGWMGTLNDWFTNEGFQSFRVSGSGSYELADGDYLNIMFTQNLGEDLGSVYGSSDTSLADLRISGGTLQPTFDGDTLEYTLSITGNSARITVTPTAVNKNYMVKTFLNHYNRDSAYYKRTESISVKPGDILYIGVGDPSWPSLNNWGTDAVEYQGTTYIVTVVNSTDAEAVIEMIETLPEITYANYKAQAPKVLAARAAYDALDSKAKDEILPILLEKLVAAEIKIKFYQEIDEVKDLLQALPKVDRKSDPTSSLIRQMKEAAAYYEDLDKEQKEYITSEDAERYEALRLWLIETGAVGLNELPIIDGSLVMPELDGIEAILEPMAYVDSSGNASAYVTAAEFHTLLEEAVEAGATMIVIAPTGADRASSISVELPRGALGGVIDEAEADLAVRTHLGEMDIPSGALSNILDGTSGQDLTVHMARLPAANAGILLAGSAGSFSTERLEAATVIEVGISSGSRIVSNFGGRSVTLLLPVDETAGYQAGEIYSVYLVDTDGALQMLTGRCRRANGSLCVEVAASKLGTFVLVPPEKPVQLPFTDVGENNWFYDAVVYAYTNGLFNGTSPTTFSPNGTMTRSMLVTVLWRMEGEPTVNSANPFTDVAAGTWYTDAVTWANANGIVNGMSATTFEPNGNLTREQIAAILYRYAKVKGWNINGASSLSAFPDGSQVAEWAVRAMEWTYSEGLIIGRDDGRLDPKGQASRAEVATILMRLLESHS